MEGAIWICPISNPITSAQKPSGNGWNMEVTSRQPKTISFLQPLYNSYELNTDFDINLNESYYRSHDPQIGRFWQIDPNPNEMVSLYSAMNNNPISNNDPLGDTSIYYNSQGQHLFTFIDNLENSIVVIPQDNEKAFYADFNKNFVNTPDDANIDADALNTNLRSYGVSYSTSEYFAYYDKNSKDIYNGKDFDNGTMDIFKPIDGKGKLKNEHAASLDTKNGYTRIIQGSDDAGNPTNASPKVGGLGIHTHTNEGRRMDVLQADGSYRSATVQSGRAGLGEDITKTSGTNARQGNFRVVVSPTHVYLYANGQVMIAVDRKLNPSKNPGEIK